jgi:hypothetical protein
MIDSNVISNPGSALGEAIGALMEKALQKLLIDISEEHGCHYITSGVRKTKSGKVYKKLLMYDNFGNEYDIDGVIANQALQPLIVIESKYIRYKKHNRDKGSWVYHAHSAIRRHYHSIRSSIAILAGNWSKSSLAMMKSNDINIFIISFDLICDLLDKQKIDFRWVENDIEKARAAWIRFNALKERQKLYIGEAMIMRIKDELVSMIQNILDNTIEREIEKVVLELVSNLGEVKVFEFNNVDEAIEFLETADHSSLFLIEESVSLFDPPPSWE